MRIDRGKTLFIVSVFCLLLLVSVGRIIESADHADTPLLSSIPRNDAKITDLFTFRDRNDLVIILCADPTVPPGVNNYTFQDDVIFDINIDRSTRVSYRDQTANETYGGTVLHPERINADLKFTITFKNGEPDLQINRTRDDQDDVAQRNRNRVKLFTGLRDDPFIRGPRIGRNVAAIVLKIPLEMVRRFDHDFSERNSDRRDRNNSSILIWADSFVPETNGVQGDLAGRSLRSMFPENEQLNYLPPNQHFSTLGVPPDVVIYDFSRPAVYPNGRGLTDDVVDLVGDSRVLGNDAPFPSQNDVPFLAGFPYLAPPQ